MTTASLVPDEESIAPPQLVQAGVRSAECLRAHGLPNITDPTVRSSFTPGHGFGYTHGEVPAGGKATRCSRRPRSRAGPCWTRRSARRRWRAWQRWLTSAAGGGAAGRAGCRPVARAAAVTPGSCSACPAAGGHGGPAAVAVADGAGGQDRLGQHTQVGGSLGYQGSYTWSTRRRDRVHAAARPGHDRAAGPATVRGGRHAGHLVLRRHRPEWRPLVRRGGSRPRRGAARREPDRAGLRQRADLSDSGYFTDATATRWTRWQAAAGLPVTGTVPLGEVGYAPGPLRDHRRDAGLGAVPQPGGQLLTATSPVPVVAAAVPVGQEYLLRPGDR